MNREQFVKSITKEAMKYVRLAYWVGAVSGVIVTVLLIAIFD